MEAKNTLLFDLDVLEMMRLDHHHVGLDLIFAITSFDIGWNPWPYGTGNADEILELCGGYKYAIDRIIEYDNENNDEDGDLRNNERVRININNRVMVANRIADIRRKELEDAVMLLIDSCPDAVYNYQSMTAHMIDRWNGYLSIYIGTVKAAIKVINDKSTTWKQRNKRQDATRKHL